MENGLVFKGLKSLRYFYYGLGFFFLFGAYIYFDINSDDLLHWGRFFLLLVGGIGAILQETMKKLILHINSDDLNESKIISYTWRGEVSFYFKDIIELNVMNLKDLELLTPLVTINLGDFENVDKLNDIFLPYVKENNIKVSDENKFFKKYFKEKNQSTR